MISRIESTFDTWIYKKIRNSCDIHLFIGFYFIYHTFIHVSNMFSTHDICVQNVQTYEWMNFAQFPLLICHMFNLWCMRKVCIQILYHIKKNSHNAEFGKILDNQICVVVHIMHLDRQWCIWVHSRLGYQKGAFNWKMITKDNFGFLLTLHYYNCSGLLNANR